MATELAKTPPTSLASAGAEVSDWYQEGIVAGMIGAATVAVWFLILDTFRGHPLYTPSLLGTALFGGREVLTAPETLTASFQMTLLYTWVHGLVFVVIGGLASLLLGRAEKNPDWGFGILLLFAIFMFGFVVVTMSFAEPVLHALTWPAILLGNFLAAVAMGTYFWRRHPDLTIRP